MRRPWIAAAAVVSVMVASAVTVSSLLGLGDAEALYYCYGQHLQLSYLDHPPLVGWLIALTTAVGGRTVLAVRFVPMIMAAFAVLNIYILTADLYGRRAAAWSSLLLLSTPVFSAGMIAATPDAPLAAVWPLVVLQLHRALSDDRPGRWPRVWRPALVGLLLGLAFLAKYTGACLVLTAVIAVAGRRGRAWLKRPGFWLGAVVAVAAASPVFIWNAGHGWAGVLHRTVWTQQEAGFSARNLGALLGGQMLYVGPLMLVLLGAGCLKIWRGRRERPDRLILLAASLPALASTYLLSLWSDAAEPHWPAAGYLALFPAAAAFASQPTGWGKRIARWAVGFGIAAFAALHLAVLTPILPATLPTESYEPKFDLANELRGWPEAAEAVRALNPEKRPVLAAFYTQCSQLAFALSRPGDPEVRCASPETDDFDLWYGDFALSCKGAVFVTDNRFDQNPEELVQDARVDKPRVTVEISRGGRWVRRFEIFFLSSAKCGENGSKQTH